MFKQPKRVSTLAVVQGFNIHAAGFDDNYLTAALKARSELVERIHTSDLVQDDTTGLVTYKSPSKWCSTGAAAHPDRDICIENSLAELVERDMVACWMSMSQEYEFLETVNDVDLVELPCMYKDWRVVASIKVQGDRTQVQAGAARTLEDAMRKAFYESFLREKLPEEFVTSRLPVFIKGSIKRGNEPDPEVTLREWKVSDLYVVKQFSHKMADFRRGVPDTKIDQYKKFIGKSEVTPLKIQRNWCH